MTKNWDTSRMTSPVQVCVENGNTEILALLLEHGAKPHGEPYYERKGTEAQATSNEPVRDVDRIRGLAPLLICAKRGDRDMVKMLLDAGLSFSKRGWLIVADIFRGEIDMAVRVLGHSKERTDGFKDWDKYATESTNLVEFWRWLASSGGPVKTDALINECEYIWDKQGKKKFFPWVCDIYEVKMFLMDTVTEA